MVQILFYLQNNENRMSGSYNHNFNFFQSCSQKSGKPRTNKSASNIIHNLNHIQELDYDDKEYGDDYYDQVVAEAEANAAKAAAHYNNQIRLDSSRPQKRGLRTVMMSGGYKK